MAPGEWNGDTLVCGWNDIDMLGLLHQFGIVIGHRRAGSPARARGGTR